MSSTPQPPHGPQDPNTPVAGDPAPPDLGPPIDDEMAPRPLDLESPQFTLRAVLTGMVLAAVLSVCNVYAGLKIGWSFNMSIVAALASYGVWQGLHFSVGTRKWGILENNINQTACSSGAAVSSAGLVAPIPALALLTGQTLDWHFLALWCFSVMLVGITVAIAIRRQMLIHDKLPFAFGIASAETLKQMYGDGAEAMKRLGMLVFGALSAGLVEHLNRLGQWFKPVWIPGSIKGYSMSSLTFGLEPNLLLYGVGGLIGIRAGISLLLGALLGYALLGPEMIDAGGAKAIKRITMPKPPVFVMDQWKVPPDGYMKYEQGRLIWEGVMSADERDQLQGLYGRDAYFRAWGEYSLRAQRNPLTPAPLDYTRYQAAVQDMYVSSQLPVLKANETLAEKVRAVDRDVSASAVNALGDADEVQAEALAVMSDPAAKLLESLERSVQTTQPISPEKRDKLIAMSAGLEDQLESSIRTVHVAQQPEVQEARAGLAAAIHEVDADADVRATTPAGLGFRPIVVWLLWPGVTLMVISSLVSFAFSWRSVLAAMGLGGQKREEVTEERHEVGRMMFMLALVAVLGLSVYLQISFFAIIWWAAVSGVLLTFVLALVAARVAGETSITPVGAMGKVTQLFFGALIPGQVAPNLMAANVTGGASSQCADLLHDMRCGYLIGASPRFQAMAQVCGALAGAMAGSAVYLLLINNPQEQLLTADWPGPAVVTWKAVAELFAVGWQALPPYALLASGIAAFFGVLFPILEKTLPKKAAHFVPSAASVGLAMVVPANYALTMFAGAVIAWVVSKIFKSWSKRFLVTLCAGIVAGDTLVGASWGIFVDTDWAEIWATFSARYLQ